WRLCVASSDDAVLDEAIFRIQGVVLKNNLTPRNVLAYHRLPRAKAKYASQQVEICGLQSEYFASELAKLEDVNEKFQDHFSGVSLVKLTQPFCAMGPSLSASNRLFTSKNDAPTEQDNEFRLGVDPIGALAKLKSYDLIHAPDNMVQYWKCVTDEETGVLNYDESVPGAFKAGDIVELQLSFVAVICGHSDIKVTAHLQAITLLDNS
ncbi:hypothetical protein C8R44DRAFT_564804, partial [Mycena epipterygia]